MGSPVTGGGGIAPGAATSGYVAAASMNQTLFLRSAPTTQRARLSIAIAGGAFWW